MLHYPFADWEDLLLIDGQAYRSYIDAFRACFQLHQHLEDFYTDPDKEDEDADPDAETDKDLGPEDGSQINYLLADFEDFARR